MKINEVIIKEAEDSGYDAMGNVTTGTPSASPVNVAAAPAPAGQGGQPKSAPAAGKVPPQPTLNGKPSTGPKGQAWLKKYGATHNPDGTPKAAAPAAAAPAADPTIDPYDPNKDTNVTQAGASDNTTAELDRLKQLAVGGAQPAPAAPPAQAAAPTPPPNVNALGIAQTANAANPLQPAPQADQPAAQAAQPAPEAPANNGIQAQQVNPVKTGTGGTLTTSDGKPVMSGSQTKLPDGTVVSTYDIKNNQKFKDKAGKEYVAQINPMNKQVTFNRSFAGVGDFVNNLTGKNPAAAPAPAPAGQGGQPASSTNAAGAMAAMKESDDALLATIRKIR